MICRRCIHRLKPAEVIRVSTLADRLFDGCVQGAAVHADRAVCATNLLPYRTTSKGGATMQRRSTKGA